MSDLKISVPIPLDDKGMIGRECLECEQYFKLKPGTGIETDNCYCPYCDYQGNMNTFWTPAQIEYAKSIAMQEAFNKLVKPTLDKFSKSFKELERKTRHSLIQIKVTTSNKNFTFPTKYYLEQELETDLTCDNCGLEFAIYGVFSKCPDCNQINAFLIYDKSLEVIKKKLDIFSKPEIPEEIVEISLSSVLTSAISAFDGLGKELRKRKPTLYPSRPNNLFQNLTLLNETLNNVIIDNHSDYNKLIEYFQVRHIYEHNMGVIDNDFARKIPSYTNLVGRKYKLNLLELVNFVDSMKELGQIIRTNYDE